jgi:hypothetical protein
MLNLSITVSQRVGASVARAGRGLAQLCGRTTSRWRLVLDNATGVAFRPGRAVLSVGRFVDDGFATRKTSVDFVIRLRSDPNARTAGAGTG